jgi:hypothetical protein
VSLFRYPTAIAAKAPKTAALVATSLWLLDHAGDVWPGGGGGGGGLSSVLPADGTAESWVAASVITLLETVVGADFKKIDILIWPLQNRATELSLFFL